MSDDKKGASAPAKKPREGVVRGEPPKVPAGAPLYRVTETPHFINGRVVEPGEEVRYAGVPGIRLEPLDDAAKKARKDADEARAKRKAQAAEAEAANAKLRGLLTN